MAAGVTYDKLGATTLATSTSSVTFNSFSGYTDLVIVTNHGTASDGSGFYIRFNSDSGNNYSAQSLGGTGSSAVAYAVTNDTQIPMNYQYNGTGTTLKNVFIINVMNYANTTTYKNVLTRMRTLDNGGTTITQTTTGLWRSTAAITSLALTGNSNFIAGSTFSLYGIKAA